MSTEVLRRRGTTSEHSTFTGGVGEITVDITKDTLVVHDGSTAGGFPLLREDFNNVSGTLGIANGGTGATGVDAALGNFSLSTELKSLADAEVQQLQNIGSSTISATQWGYLGSQDQDTNTTASPTFAGATINGSLTSNNELKVERTTNSVRGMYLHQTASGPTSSPRLIFAYADQVSNAVGIMNVGSALSFRTGMNYDSSDGSGRMTISSSLISMLLPASMSSTLEVTGNITFDQDLLTDDFSLGTGSTGWAIDGALGAGVKDNGSTKHLYVDDLTVRGNARFFSVQIKETSVIGGEEVLSIGNGRIASVSYPYSGTIGYASGSDVVSGTGTLFTTEIQAGYVLYAQSGDSLVLVGTVDTVDSNTEITLLDVAPATGAGASFFSSNDLEVLELEDPNNYGGTAFAANDLCFVKLVDVNNPGSFSKSQWRKVKSVSGTTVNLQADSTNTPTTLLQSNELLVIYGNTATASRQSIIYRSVEGTPVVRVQSGINSPSALSSPASTTELAFGDLNGLVTGISSEEYGIAAGDMTLASNHFLFTENQASVRSDVFRFVSDGLDIDSAGTTYPAASEFDSPLPSSGSFLTSTTFSEVDSEPGLVVRFKFDYNVSFSTPFATNFTIEVEGRLDGTSTWQSISGFSGDLEFIDATYNILTQSAGTISVSNTSDSTKVQLTASGSGSNTYSGTLTFYLFVSPTTAYDGFRLKMDETSAATTANASSITGKSYKSVTEINPKGIWGRLSDTLIERSGTIFQDTSLLA